MRSRFVCALGVSIVFAVACGGGAFSGASDDVGGSGGGGATAGTGSGGKVWQGGKSGSATGGSSSKGGGTSGSASGGDVSSSGSDPGGSVGVSGSGGSVSSAPCDAPSDCDVDSPCLEPTCNGNVCGSKPVADGPYKLQVPGDCQRMDCVDGNETIVVDVNDYEDNNECTSDSCYQDGTPRHAVMFSQACANGGGLCNAQGTCDMCIITACPAATACHGPVCTGGLCKLAPKPAGELCNPTPNDAKDQYDQCDGAGNCIDCVTSGGCGECCVCTADHACQDA